MIAQSSVESTWKEIPACEYCESVRDGTHDSPKFVSDGFPLVTSKHIKDGIILSGEAALISRTDFEQINRRSKVDTWDVLITMIGTVGDVAIVRDDPPQFAIKNLGLFKTKSELDGRWLYYWLKSPQAKGLVFQRLAGASQQYLTLGHLRAFPVRTPVDETRKRRIVDTLGLYDDLIENNRRRIKLLEEAARLIYREWFVRLRFPGHEHTRIVDGVPEGWRRTQLRNAATVNDASLSSKYSGFINYIDIASVSPGTIDKTEYMDFREAPSRARRVVRHGDIIWSCVRPNRRSHAIVWNPIPNLIASTGFAVITPISVPTTFLYQAVTTKEFVEHLALVAKGAAYPAVVSADFEQSDILVPSDSVLAEYDRLVRPMVELCTLLKASNSRLGMVRDLLLPRLMSGEIEV